MMPYGKRHPVVLRWSSIKSSTLLNLSFVLRRLQKQEKVKDRSCLLVDPTRCKVSCNTSTTERCRGLVRLVGTRYMVVDCGGGTVDITVHEMENEASGNLRELYKAAGGPYGSTGMLCCASVEIKTNKHFTIRQSGDVELFSFDRYLYRSTSDVLSCAMFFLNKLLSSNRTRCIPCKVKVSC